MNEYSRRTILHCDLNNFYASVECFYNPSLKNKPVIVAGDVDLRHGIVLAKNQIAKNAGIKTGMTIWEANQKISGLVSIKANFERYLTASRKVKDIYKRYTDQIESFGIDECWLDVTNSSVLFGDGEHIANELRAVIKKELGLTISVGVSFNKVFAKLGSDMKKPDATTIITQENFKSLVWPLPASELLYVGRSTEAKLNRYGINTIGDLANADETFLKKVLGKWGEYLKIFAEGHDATPVSLAGESAAVKSVGNSMTAIRDLKTITDVNLIFNVLSDSIGMRLRDYGFKGAVVSIWVRDNELETRSYQGQLSRSSFLARDIYNKACELFTKHNFKLPLRSLGINVTGLNEIDNFQSTQLDFFVDEKKIIKNENVELTVDKIRHRFGHAAIYLCSLNLDKELTMENPREDHVIHPYSFF